MIEISVVVPVRDENENIKPFLQRTENVLNTIGKSYEIIFALDPSSDNTEKVILDEIKRNKNIKLLVFSRQFGQPAATIAGILNCKGSYCVIIDVDLQDPPEIIEKLYKKVIAGYEVVYAKRKKIVKNKLLLDKRKFRSQMTYQEILFLRLINNS